MESVALGEVIAQAAGAVTQLLDERGVTLVQHIGTAPLSVRGDRDRLIQVVINLLSNAAKFAPAHSGRIDLHLESEAGLHRVCVVDNGPGIAAEDLELVFEKFRQSSRGGEKPLGTGLGLPICRQIIQHHGGRIWAERRPAEGGRVCFVLPSIGLSADAASNDPAADQASPGPGGA
jgi:signal transduction histidine kinase